MGLASHRTLALLITAAFMAAPFPAADGQQQHPAQAHQHGVYLNDCLEADELISQLLQDAERKSWRQALDRLEKITSQHGRQVALASDRVYSSIPRRLQRTIASWPHEGLAAYRDRFEEQARTALSAAMQSYRPDEIAPLIEEYFCTSAAREAAVKLAEIHSESGRFSAAATVYQRLLRDHPDRAGHRLDWQAGLVVMLAQDRKHRSAETILEQEGSALREHQVTWHGTVATVAQLLDRLASQPVLPLNSELNAAWPSVSAPSAMQAAAGHHNSPSAPLWNFDIPPRPPQPIQPGLLQDGLVRDLQDHHQALTMLPVVEHGIVYFTDGAGVWAVHGESGKLLWSYRDNAPPPVEGLSGDRLIPGLYACTVFRDRVYANLGRQPDSFYGFLNPPGQSVLTCLSAATGQELWRVEPVVAGATAGEFSFDGPVMVDESGAYVVVRRRKAFGFEDCYLWKLDPAGTVAWRTHLASASTGGFGYRRPTLSIPSLISGVIYIETNLGATAAVDAYSGLVEWISVHATAGAEESLQQAESAPVNTTSWDYNFILQVDDDSIISAPLNAPDLLVLDRFSGEIEQRIPRQRCCGVRTLLGIIDGKLYGAGDALVRWDLASEAPDYCLSLSGGTLLGRAAITTSAAYVPCAEGLFTSDLDGRSSLLRPWNAASEGGNVLALGDLMVVAGDRRITAYGVREAVYARLEARMNAEPASVSAALDLAETAYRTAFAQTSEQDSLADHQRGDAALHEAIRRAGGLASLWDDQDRRRIFENCLSFAGMHMRRTPPNSDAALALLDLAEHAAPDSLAQLRYRCLLASIHALRKDPHNELQQYHYILSDRSLARLPWPDSATPTQLSAEVCSRKIAALIEKHGREIYSAFDRQAAVLLTAALRTRDLESLDYIIETFANSPAAAEALLGKAHILRQVLDQPHRAVRSYYAALSRYPEQVDQAQTIRLIADCFMQANQPAAAWQWLTCGARNHPLAKVEHEKDRISLLEYRQRLSIAGAARNGERPALGSSLPKSHDWPLTEEEQFLQAEFPDQLQSDWSRFFTWQNEELHSIDSASANPLWSASIPGNLRPRLLAHLQHVVVLATRFELLGLNPVDGQVLWRTGQSPAAADDPSSDPESWPAWKLCSIGANLAVCIRSDDLAVGVDLDAGRVIWQRELTRRSSQFLTIDGRSVIYRSVLDDRQIISVLSRSDGQETEFLELQDEDPIINIIPTLAGNMLLVTSSSLLAVNPADSLQEWRVEWGESYASSSIRVLVDGVIVSPDGMSLLKLSLDDGRVLWQSDPLARQPVEVEILIDNDELYLVLGNRIAALDIHNGRTLGQVRLPTGTSLAHAELLQDQLAVVCQRPALDDETVEYWVLLTGRPIQSDRELQLSQAIPLDRIGGRLRFYFLNYAILGVSDSALHGWMGGR